LTDEPAVLLKNCPEAGLVVNPNRSAGARKAVEELGADVLILDDGFQHRRLNRDLDIVVIDATCPFGFDRLVPAGLLREPVASLRRADLIVITRAEQVKRAQVEELVGQIQTIRPGIVIGISANTHPYVHLLGGHHISTGELRGKTAMAFCGIGNPEAFYQQLRQYGVDLVETRTFDDHHSYSDNDLSSLYEQAAKTGAEYLLTTEKDWVKSAVLSMDDKPIRLAYLPMKLEFIEGGDTIESVISDCLGRISDRPEGTIHV
jgi:tetraacyldisaccharide 4'-kinase